MEFIDRTSAYPNRYLMTDENGNASYVVLERADEPITPGTPLNAETFNSLLLCDESEHKDCFNRKYADAAPGEVEWLNPPMMEGVVYRTLERYHGKPVYVMEMSLGTVPAGENKLTAYHGQVGIAPIRCEGVGISPTRGQMTLPVTVAEGDAVGSISVYATSELIRCVINNFDMSNAEIRATMWFVRG